MRIEWWLQKIAKKWKDNSFIKNSITIIKPIGKVELNIAESLNETGRERIDGDGYIKLFRDRSNERKKNLWIINEPIMRRHDTINFISRLLLLITLRGAFIRFWRGTDKKIKVISIMVLLFLCGSE